MTTEQITDTYDRIDKVIRAKNFVAECWKDTQLTFDIGDYRGELDEKLSVFKWFFCKRLCERGIKAILICITEAIAVATAMSMGAPQLIEYLLIAISPLASKRIVDSMGLEYLVAAYECGY